MLLTSFSVYFFDNMPTNNLRSETNIITIVTVLSFLYYFRSKILRSFVNVCPIFWDLLFSPFFGSRLRKRLRVICLVSYGPLDDGTEPRMYEKEGIDGVRPVNICLEPGEKLCLGGKPLM